MSSCGLINRFRDQRGRCFYCRRHMSFTQSLRHKDGRRITREHLIPRCKGGKAGANVVAACLRCNGARGSSSWLDYYCSPAVTHARLMAASDNVFDLAK